MWFSIVGIVKQVIVVNRHGDRAPIWGGQGTKWKHTESEKLFWASLLPEQSAIENWNREIPVITEENTITRQSFPYGQLTRLGVDQARTLGTQLRKKYIEDLQVFGDNVEEGDIFVRSTNYPRSIQTAQNLLIAMFDGIPKPLGISVHVRNPSHETLVPSPENCPRERQLVKMIRANVINHMSPQWAKELEKRLEKSLGIGEEGTQMTRVVWSAVREELHCRVTHGLSLPKGIYPSMVDQIARYNVWLWRQWYVEPSVARLSTGRLFQEILAEIDTLVLGIPNKARLEHEIKGGETSQAEKSMQAHPAKLVLLSCHDSTIIALLGAINMLPDEWPSYTSYVVFEVGEKMVEQNDKLVPGFAMSGMVHFSGGSHAVRILYNGEPITPWIPYDILRRRLEQLIPHDYETECSVHV